MSNTTSPLGQPKRHHSGDLVFQALQKGKDGPWICRFVNTDTSPGLVRRRVDHAVDTSEGGVRNAPSSDKVPQRLRDTDDHSDVGECNVSILPKMARPDPGKQGSS